MVYNERELLNILSQIKIIIFINGLECMILNNKTRD